jgi:hypothetical protein
MKNSTFWDVIFQQQKMASSLSKHKQTPAATSARASDNRATALGVGQQL